MSLRKLTKIFQSKPQKTTLKKCPFIPKPKEIGVTEKIRKESVWYGLSGQRVELTSHMQKVVEILWKYLPPEIQKHDYLYVVWLHELIDALQYRKSPNFVTGNRRMLWIVDTMRSFGFEIETRDIPKTKTTLVLSVKIVKYEKPLNELILLLSPLYHPQR